MLCLNYLAVQISKDGSQFVMLCADSRIRIWRFATGKLPSACPAQRSAVPAWRKAPDQGW